MNRLLLYFRQAWQIIRQEKLFSTIYIVGTALSIMMVMILAIVMYIRLADIYPETNRSRTLSVSRAMVTGDGITSISNLSQEFIRQVLLPLEAAEAVTAIYGVYEGENYVQSLDRREQYLVKLKYVDTGFWKVFPFRFMQGEPFTDGDLESGLNVVVISASLARKLFGITEVVGRVIGLDFRECRISGVVQDASSLTPESYASIWMPYTAYPDFKPAHYPENSGNALGAFSAFVLASSSGKLNDLESQIRENAGRFDSAMGEEKQLSLFGQPDTHWQKVIRSHNFKMEEGFDFRKELLKYAGLFLLLLAVPAVCLSGMTGSRMERRVSELAVRRAFGARNSSLFMQVIGENMLFTFLGGVLGLLFSYLVLFLTRSWIMDIGGYGGRSAGVEVSFHTEMLFNPEVFMTAFLVCLFLNVLSAFVPAWRASRKEIVESLKAE